MIEDLKNMNPFSANIDPRETRIREMTKDLLNNINKMIEDKHKDKDDIMSSIKNDPALSLCLANVFSLIYDQDINCLVLTDILFDEYNKKEDGFNSLTLLTNSLTKDNVIKLKDNNKLTKTLLFEVVDKDKAKELTELSNTNYNSITDDLLKNLNIKEANTFIEKMKTQFLNKYNEDFIKNKSEKEINDIFENDIAKMTESLINNINTFIKKQ